MNFFQNYANILNLQQIFFFKISDGEACDLDPSDILDRGVESDSDGGPGALLVEVEDVEEETAAPLVACTPILVPQTPIYKYGQAQERHRAW